MTQVLHAILLVLAHNENHYLVLEHAGRRYHVCTRCSGMTIGVAAGIPLILLLNLPLWQGPQLAAVSLLFFLPDFLYWALTRVRLIRDLPILRFLAGIMLGIALLGFGQARIGWGVKVLVTVILFALVILANPVLGRRSAT